MNNAFLTALVTPLKKQESWDSQNGGLPIIFGEEVNPFGSQYDRDSHRAIHSPMTDGNDVSNRITLKRQLINRTYSDFMER